MCLGDDGDGDDDVVHDNSRRKNINETRNV